MNKKRLRLKRWVSVGVYLSLVSLDIPRFHMLYSYLIILYNMKKQMYIRKINAITKQEIYNYAINYDNGE